jgi:hypothetical protein
MARGDILPDEDILKVSVTFVINTGNLLLAGAELLNGPMQGTCQEL